MRNLKRALSLALASVMVLGLMVVGTGASYADVTSEQNQEAIEVLQAVGIMVGDDNGNFNPEANVTRNEMAVVMSNLMDYRVATYAGTSPFTDVPSWAEPYVAACWTNGITSGYTATLYGGSDSVTTSQAALMLMKALGYFQYQSDFEDDWQLATVKQANKIDLFDDVDSGVRDAMTRNDLAQLVLNTLEAGTVEADDDTIKVTTDGATVEAGSVTYNFVTSGRSYASAIDNLSTYTSSAGTGGSAGYIVELGEKLYQGDLKKATAGDDFGRPSNVWTYKSTEIGKYADSAAATWTAKVSEKALYTAVGSAAYDNYQWTIFQNGYERYSDGNGHAARDAAISHSKSSSERVLTSGNGVLTQVFVDDDAETVVLTMIETAVGEVTRIAEDDGMYEVTISQKTRVNNGRGSAFTPDSTFTTDKEFTRGDIVIYTASVASGEIESMAVAETAAGTITAVKSADYVSLDGTTYNYNYSYTRTNGASDYAIGSGIYNLDDSTANQDPAIDKDATLYLDAYGYAVAFSGETNTPEDYLYITEVGEVFKSEPSAKVVFYDGTKATIDIDKVTDQNGNTYDATTVAGQNGTIAAGTVYKFTKGSSSYDLEKVNQNKGTNADIKKDNPTISATGAANNTRANNNTVYVDTVNNKAWTGYSNVSSKAGADITVVNDKGVAMIVFISGNFATTPDDDDYIILTGTGMEAVKDANNKTVYRFTSAYDIDGNKLSDAYSASRRTGLVKGLYLITSRDGDDYVTSMDLRSALINNNTYTVAGASATRYATNADAGLLVLNSAIDFGTAANPNPKTTFAYNNSTTYIVVTQTSTGDVDTISVGSFSDIEDYESAAGADNRDLTGVYVMTVGDATDDAPLAESVLVIVPYTGSTIGGGGSTPTPVAGNVTMASGLNKGTITSSSATVSSRGNGNFNFSLKAPAWVADNATATFTYSLYVNDKLDTNSSGSLVRAGAQSYSFNASAGNGFDPSDKLTVVVTAVTYSDVKVQYVKADGTAVDMAANTIATLTTSSASPSATFLAAVDNNKYTGPATFTVTGATLVGSDTWAASIAVAATATGNDIRTNGSGSNGVYANGDGYVTVTISGLTDKTPSYAVNQATGITLESKGVTATNDKALTLTIGPASNLAGVESGRKINIYAKLSGTLTENYGYVVDIAGIGSVLLTNTTSTLVGEMTVTGPKTFAASDVSVIKTVEKLKVTGATWVDEDTITVTFNRDVEGSGADGAFANTDVTFAAGDSRDTKIKSVTASGSTMTVEFSSDTGTALSTATAADVLTLTNAVIDAEYNTATGNKLTQTTVTLKLTNGANDVTIAPAP